MALAGARALAQPDPSDRVDARPLERMAEAAPADLRLWTPAREVRARARFGRGDLGALIGLESLKLARLDRFGIEAQFKCPKQSAMAGASATLWRARQDSSRRTRSIVLLVAWATAVLLGLALSTGAHGGGLRPRPNDPKCPVVNPGDDDLLVQAATSRRATPKEPTQFVASQVATDFIGSLHPLISSIARWDRCLADQIRRLSAVLLNVAGGDRRVGKDRLDSSRIAAGSAAEVNAVSPAARSRR